MAIGWMTVLKSVPWGDVISNAPAIADGAQKLWKSARRQSEPAPASEAEPAAPQDAVSAARVAELESKVAGLQRQMEQSSALINQLAQQNAQLVARVELMRSRVRAALFALGGVAVALLLTWALMLGR